ncbi:MAG: hypothetical protein ACRYFS_00710 [Janthinobacterium lividum]
MFNETSGKDQETVREIVSFISGEHDTWRQKTSSGQEARRAGVGKVHGIYQRVAQHWRAVNERELEGILKQPIADLAQTKAFVYLKPVEHDSWIAPILSISYDFERDFPMMRLRLSMFVLDDNDELKAIGYRFETPESEGDGIHNYYHAQMIYRFDKVGKIKDLPCPKWIPQTQPAFALDATSPCTLLACMLCSVYGREYVYKNIVPICRSQQEQLGELAFLKSPHVPQFSSPKDNDNVGSLTSIHGTVASNQVGDTISHVHLFLRRDNDEHYWNGSSWVFEKRYVETSMVSQTTNSIWRYECSLLKHSTLMDGLYSLRAVAYDQKRRLNSKTIMVSVG